MKIALLHNNYTIDRFPLINRNPDPQVPLQLIYLPSSTNLYISLIVGKRTYRSAIETGRPDQAETFVLLIKKRAFPPWLNEPFCGPLVNLLKVKDLKEKIFSIRLENFIKWTSDLFLLNLLSYRKTNLHSGSNILNSWQKLYVIYALPLHLFNSSEILLLASI